MYGHGDPRVAKQPEIAKVNLPGLELGDAVSGCLSCTRLRYVGVDGLCVQCQAHGHRHAHEKPRGGPASNKSSCDRPYLLNLFSLVEWGSLSPPRCSVMSWSRLPEPTGRLCEPPPTRTTGSALRVDAQRRAWSRRRPRMRDVL